MKQNRKWLLLVLGLAIVLVVDFPIIQKYMISGATAGAVKG